MDKECILFYDSGVGGLTTFAETYKILPHENYIYFADDKNCPYGNKSVNEIKKTVLENLNNIFKGFKIKTLVFACNTATASCVDDIRAQCGIDVVGIEPAIMLANKVLPGKGILTIATNLTINQKRYIQLTKRAIGNVYSLGLQNLARDVEDNLLFDKPIDKEFYINKIKKILKTNKEISSLVLGCTHYSYLKDYFSKELRIPVFDGNKGVAYRISNIVKSKNKNGGEVNIVLSSKDQFKEKRYYELFFCLKNKE